MKRKFKNVMVLGLAIVLLAVPSLSFADVVTTGTMTGTGYQDKLNERLSEKLANIEEKGAAAIVKRDAYRARMTEVINEFAPDLLATFESFWVSHDSVHTSLIAERERIANEQYAEAIAFSDSIKAAVLAGEMTREEAKTAIQAYRSEVKIEREATKAAIDALRLELDVPQGTVKAYHEALKAAVVAGDAASVELALLDLISIQPQHLAFDQAKLELLMSK